MATESKAKVGRRDFLWALGVGVSASSTPLATSAYADNESNDERRKSRYRETEDVKTFYRVNRYPDQR